MCSNPKTLMVDKDTDIITDQTKEHPDGKFTWDSILKGEVKVDADGYVDKLLELLNKKLDGDRFNSFDLPEENIEFDREVACTINLPGTAYIRNGRIKGLATFSRKGDLILDVDPLRDPIALLKVSLAIKEATIHYDGKINFWCLTPALEILGNLADVAINIDLNVNSNLTVDLHEFEVASKGNLQLNFANLGYFEIVSGDLSVILENSIKKSTAKYLEKSVRERFAQIVSVLQTSNLKVEVTH